MRRRLRCLREPSQPSLDKHVEEDLGEENYINDQSRRNESPSGILTINVLEAKGVPPMDYTGSSDPYIVLKFGEQKMKTRVLKRTLNPKWSHEFRVLVYPDQLSDKVTLEVWDWDKISSDDYIGETSFSIHDYTSKKPQGVYHSLELKYEPILSKRKRILKKIVRVKEEPILFLQVKFTSNDQLEEIFWSGIVEYFDIDGSNGIEIDEFSPLLHGINPHCAENIDIEQLFAEIDINNQGRITSEELYTFMKNRDNPLVKQIMPMTNDIIWKIFLSFSEEHKNIGGLVMSEFQIDSLDESSVNGKTKRIHVVVRNTGKTEIELIPNYIRVSMRLMYSNRIGRKTTSRKKVRALLKHMSVRQGKTYSSPKSKHDIAPFIAFHKLNVDEILDDLDSFQSFNDFFYRKLKPDARPVAYPDDNKIVVSPADSRLHVFNTVEDATRVWIKGEKFSLENLLRDESLAAVFKGGSVVISRLAPQDYHRYHSPVTGKLGSEFTPIDGTYYTVNPIAVAGNVDVFCGNKRLIVPIETVEYGLVCFIAVGATMVGSINMTVEPGQRVRKGQELGYFAFGGSSIILLFRKGVVDFDDDLLANSSKPMETVVQVATRIGKLRANPLS